MKNKLHNFIGYILVASLFPACKTADCGCENNINYKKRKMKVSLLNTEKNSTFALQKEEIRNNINNL